MPLMSRELSLLKESETLLENSPSIPAPREWVTYRNHLLDDIPNPPGITGDLLSFHSCPGLPAQVSVWTVLASGPQGRIPGSGATPSSALTSLSGGKSGERARWWSWGWDGHQTQRSPN